MRKKDYVKPSMQVFELKQQQQLLAGSQLDDPEDYLQDEDPFNF